MNSFKSILTFIFFLTLNNLYAQNNLVPNSSFENGDFLCGATPNEKYEHFNDHIDSWRIADVRTSLQYFKRLPTPDWWDKNLCTWYNPPLNNGSDRFVGLASLDDFFCEGVTISLTEKLRAGKLYAIRLRMAQSGGQLSNKNQIRIHLSENTEFNRSGAVEKDVTNFIIDANSPWSWYSKQSIFSINGTNDNILGRLTIQSHYNNEDGTYGFIDDVELFEYCPPTLSINNRTHNFWEFPWEGKRINATNTLVKDQAGITYKAPEEIILGPGFQVEKGANFKGFIAPCGSDCFNPVSSAGSNVTVCDNAPVGMGMSPQYGMTYSWSAIPASALAYLSNPAISNPVFTKPSTGYGSVKYTLAVSNSCGQSAASTRTVNYGNGSAPSITLSNITYGDFPSFRADVHPETEQVQVEVRDNSYNLLKTYTLIAGQHFTGTSFNYQVPDYFFSCISIKIIVKAKNYCNPNYAQQSIQYSPNTAINLISYGPGSYVNRNSGCYKVNVRGAQNYEIEIKTPSGSVAYSATGTITNDQWPCLWNFSCPGGTCPDGTYYVTKLRLWNCFNSYSVSPYYIQLVRSSSRIANQDSSATPDGVAKKELINVPEKLKDSSNMDEDVQIFPNPNNGSFKMVYGVKSKNVKVYLYDFLGKLVFESDKFHEEMDMDLSSHSKGIYWIKIISDSQTITRKVIYQ